jgi:type IV pilus biogenesis/stability protein PilW
MAKELGLKERKIKKFLEKQTRKEKRAASFPVSRPWESRNKILLSVILIVIIGFSVYANSISGEFIWDDEHLVSDNRYIRDWSNVSKFFTEGMAAGADAPTMYSFYRPFQLITYTLDYSLWKLDPRGYHLTNISLHVLVALAVFWLITILYKDWVLALITGLFFVAHPVHTEAVSYIAGRADSLAALFMLGCFIVYVKIQQRDRKTYFIWMVLSYVLAVLSKELSLILPVLLLLYHFTFRQRVKWKAFLPILAVTILYIVLRMTVLNFLSEEVIHKTTHGQRVAGFFVAMVNYVRIMILPLNLHMEYGNSFYSFGYPLVWGGIVLVFVLIALIAKTALARNIVFFALAWFLINLIPSSNLLYPINAYMAEHWLYLPSIGIFLLLAKGLTLLSREKGLKSLSIGAVVLFLGVYSFLTIDQNGYWKTKIPFYLRTIKYANNSSRVYYNLANEYRELGQNEKAIENYDKALKVRPDYYEAYYNLGKTYENMSDREKAIEAYQKVLSIEPDYDKAHYNLGNLYYESGRIGEAIASFETAIRVNPKHINAYNNLGVALAAAGRDEEAEAIFKKAIAMDPRQDISYGNLAIFYFGRQKYDQAVEYYKKAVTLGFEDPKFHIKISPYLETAL